MTREEAIKILQRDLEIQKKYKALPDGIEAMEMAIEALQKLSFATRTTQNTDQFQENTTATAKWPEYDAWKVQSDNGWRGI